jgi:hypothetical protein
VVSGPGVTGNVHRHHEGRRVRALVTRHQRRSVDFPGWGAEDYRDYLLDIPEGLTGVVTDVESHGSNPWTRYSVRFSDGTTASGLALGEDIAFDAAVDAPAAHPGGRGGARPGPAAAPEAGTFQAREPITELRFAQSGRMAEDLVRQLDRGVMTVDVPYQRGDVWTPGQRILLVSSLLSGTPVAALVINRRPERMRAAAGDPSGPLYAVIDGRQRLTTIRMLLSGELAVPASWFPARDVLEAEETPDGPYVRWGGLARPQHRRIEDRQLAVEYASVGSVEEEAAIFVRVNGYGTPQSAAALGQAARIAGRHAPGRDRDAEPEL